MLLAALLVLAGGVASGMTVTEAGNGAAAISLESRAAVGAVGDIAPGQVGWDSGLFDDGTLGCCVAPRTIPSGRPTAPTPDIAFHHTSAEAAESIARTGLRPGGFATPNGGLCPLQAQIDLALPPNRGLPGGLVQVDVERLRRAGFEIPEVTQVGRSYNMPGGRWEMQFPYEVPSEFVKSVSNRFPL